MRTIIVLLMLGTFLSCEKRVDYFANKNQAPELYVINSLGEEVKELEDSIKVNVTSQDIEYVYYDENLSELNIYYDSEFYHDSANNKISFMATESGILKAVVTAKDIYNECSEINAFFTAFDNLAPVANFNISVNDDYSITIDASSSFDKDAKYGGEVVAYKYRIGAFETDEIKLNAIKYKFPSEGTYSIIVKVKDNNGAWSDEKHKYVVI